MSNSGRISHEQRSFSTFILQFCGIMSQPLGMEEWIDSHNKTELSLSNHSQLSQGIKSIKKFPVP